MLKHQGIGITQLSYKQVGVKKSTLPNKITYAERDYYFWYYLLRRSIVVDGAVYKSEPDALLFVMAKETS